MNFLFFLNLEPVMKHNLKVILKKNFNHKKHTYIKEDMKKFIFFIIKVKSLRVD